MTVQRIFIVAFICTLLLVLPLPVSGEQISVEPGFLRAPVEEWSQVFGGPEYEWGNSVAQTSDGGYIVTGTTYSYGAGNGDIWLIKTDADGNQEWDELFGGSEVEYGESVAETSDGGYIVVGSTMSYATGHSDVWLIKTDAHGVEEWSELFGGSDEDHGDSVAQTSDGGYIIAASTQSYGAGSSDVWLIKTDAHGVEEWSELFGGSEWDFGESVAQTSDGGYIITGCTESYGAGGSDAWLIKTDAHGAEEWSELFGGTSYDGGYSVAVTSDGGYIIAGDTASDGSGGSDVWLIKLSDSDTQVTPGDGNGDGAVNALDITKVERVIVALDAETPGSDANGDGNINAMDITKIEMIIAGID